MQQLTPEEMEEIRVDAAFDQIAAHGADVVKQLTHIASAHLPADEQALRLMHIIMHTIPPQYTYMALTQACLKLAKLAPDMTCGDDDDFPMLDGDTV